MTLFLSEQQKERLEALARKHGCLQTRGAGAGKIGSVSALVRAIAIGELRVIYRGKRQWATKKKAMARGPQPEARNIQPQPSPDMLQKGG